MTKLVKKSALHLTANELNAKIRVLNSKNTNLINVVSNTFTKQDLDDITELCNFEGKITELYKVVALTFFSDNGHSKQRLLDIKDNTITFKEIVDFLKANSEKFENFTIELGYEIWTEKNETIFINPSCEGIEQNLKTFIKSLTSYKKDALGQNNTTRLRNKEILTNNKVGFTEFLTCAVLNKLGELFQTDIKARNIFVSEISLLID